MALALYPITELSWSNVLEHVYDETRQALRTTTEVNTTFTGDIEVALHSTEDSVALGDTSGNLVTTTTIGSDVGLDVNIVGGTVTTGGLYQGLKSSAKIIGDTPTPILVSGMALRDGLSVRIVGKNTVYFGHSAVSTANGYPKYNKEEISVDITDALDLYAVCESGKSCEIRIFEVG